MVLGFEALNLRFCKLKSRELTVQMQWSPSVACIKILISWTGRAARPAPEKPENPSRLD